MLVGGSAIPRALIQLFELVRQPTRAGPADAESIAWHFSAG